MKKEQSIVSSSSKLPRVAIHEREETEGRVRGGGGLIWTAEEYRIVRQRHRIVGALLGSLPGYRQQDATRGLPVLLSAEEMHVLVTNDWARVIRRRKKQRKEEEEEEDEEETTLTTTTRKDETTMRQMERDQAKMRALKASKRSRWGGAKKKQKATTTTTTTKKKKKRDEEEGHDDEKSDDASIVDWEQVLGKSSAVVLPLTSETDARLDEDVPEKDDAGERSVLSQMSKIDRYKCAVFKDLHEKGFTMTSAAKFGGDYLAYPGDPMLFHAYFTVRVLERGEKMTPLSCSSVTRMAHAARKNVVFAFCGEEGEEKNTDGGKKSSANNNHVLRIRYFTCVPDIELSSNRGF